MERIISKTYLLSYGCEFSIPGMTGIAITRSEDMPTAPGKFWICGEIWIDKDYAYQLDAEPLDLSIRCKLNSQVLKDCELIGIEIVAPPKPEIHQMSYIFIARDFTEDLV